MSTERQTQVEEAPVRYEVRGPTAWITLDRPEKLNAVAHAMYGRVGQLMRQAGEDDNVLSVVLHGRGRAFSAHPGHRRAGRRRLSGAAGHQAGVIASTGAAAALGAHSMSRPRVSGMVVYTRTPIKAAAATYSHTRSRWPFEVNQVVM